MFKLRIGFFIGGIATGFVLIFNFLTSLPDGKLHIVFCDVGQGDAAYVRFPDGRDMVVDGGPSDKVLGCLGRYMPFWDRGLDIVMLTHPEKDHLQGLLGVLERYQVGFVVRSGVVNTTEGYQKFADLVKTRGIKEKFAVSGERISIGKTQLSIVAPSSQVLGASTQSINEVSIVFLLRFGSFDALFTGDATMHEGLGGLADNQVEVLKVPHHGSKYGMKPDFLDWLNPQLAVISVGKNNYGHPTPEILKMLANAGSRVLRTDETGDIEVVSDGKRWMQQ